MNTSDALIHVQRVRTSTPSVSLVRPRSALVHSPFRGTVNLKNTPKQYAKDLGDIILGGPAGTKQLQNTLAKHDSVFQYVPILNKIAGAGLMIHDRFIEPLFKGEVGTAFINSLETIGGSLDILANPIKSLLPIAGGGNEGDFLRSMGWLEGEYRKTYQWDSGNFVVDLLGEIVSDPLNWATFGTKQLVKSGIDATVPTARSLLDDVGVRTLDLTSDAKLGIVKKKLSSRLMQQPKNVQDKVLRQLSEAIIQTDEADVIKKLNDIFIDQTITRGAQTGKLVFSDLGKALDLDGYSYRSLKNKILKASRSGMFDSYKTILRVKEATNAFEKGLIRVAVDLTPIGWSKELVKYIIKPSFEYVSRSVVEQMKDIAITDPMDVQQKSFESLKRNAFLRGEAISDYSKRGRDSIKLLLDANNMTYEDAANLYMDTITSSMSTPGVPRTNEVFRNQFKQHLQSRLKGVYIASPDDAIWRKVKPSLFNEHILHLDTVINLPEYHGINTIVPEFIFNDFYWDIYSNTKELIKAQEELIGRHIKVFQTELQQAFTKYGKSKKVFDAPILKPYIAAGVAEPANAKGFIDTITREVKHINSEITTLKQLAIEITNKDFGWLGSYKDKQLFWRALKEKNPSTTINVLGEILNHGLVEGASEKAIAIYNDYLIRYTELLKYIEEMPKDFYMNLPSIVSKNANTNEAVIDTLYAIYNNLDEISNTTMYPIRDILSYLDGGFLKVNNRVYSLDELPEYFKAAEEAGVSTTHASVMLDYFGINFNNARSVKELYNIRTPEAINRLHLILEQGKSGQRAYNAGIDAFRDINVRNVSIVNPNKTSLVTDSVKEIQKDMQELFSQIPGYVSNDEVVANTISNLGKLNDYFHSIQFTNINAVDMQVFERVMEQLKIMPYEFDELWNEVLTTDFTKLSVESYLEVSNKAQAVIDTIDSARRIALEAQQKLPSTVDKFFDELKHTMSLVLTDVKARTADKLDLTESIYVTQLSREGMLHIQFDKEFNRLDTKYGLLFKELKNPNSLARINLLDLAVRLEGAGFPNAGEQLRELLLHIDNHVALNRLMQMQVKPVWLTYDEFTQRYLNAALYNKLASDTYKNLTPLAMLQQLDKLVDDLTKDAEGFLSTRIDALAAAKLEELTDIKKFILADAKRSGIAVNFDNSIGQLGRTINNTITINLDRASNMDAFISSIKTYADRTERINMQALMEHIHNSDDAILSTYLHEKAHILSKDTLKKELRINNQSIALEVQARRDQIRFMQQLKSKDTLIKAELERIRQTYYQEAQEYLHLLQLNEFKLGITNNRVYDVMNGNMLDLVNSIGKSNKDIAKALTEYTEDATLKTDYDDLTKALFGQGGLNRRNASWYGLQHLDYASLAALNSTFSDESFVKAARSAFNYIGVENQMLAGATGNIKQVGYLQNLLTKSQVEQLIDKAGIEANLAEWSMANRNIAFRKVFDPKEALRHNIVPNDTLVIKSNSDYLNWYQGYMTYAERARNVYQYIDSEQLYTIRKGLIDTYKHAGIFNAPKDALAYFTGLDITNPEDRIRLIIWDGLTQDITYSPTAAGLYSSYLQTKLYNASSVAVDNMSKLGIEYDRLDNFRNPWRWYQMVDTATKANTYVNVDAITDIIKMNPPAYVLDALYPRFDYNISTLYKSPEKLAKTNIPYTKYIQDDLDNRRFTVDAIKKELNKGTRFTYKGLTKREKSFYESLGIREGASYSSANVQNALKQVIQRDEAESIARATAEQLRSVVDSRGGYLVFMDDIGEASMHPFEKLTEQELKAHGLVISKQSDELYLIRRTSLDKHTAELNWVRTDLKPFKSMLDMKEKVFEKNRFLIDTEGMNTPYYYLTGDTMPANFYDYIRTLPDFSDFFGDADLQKTYLELSESGATTFYKNGYSRPQVTIVGRDGYNRFLNYLRFNLNSPADWSRQAEGLINSLQSGMVDWITRHNNKTKLLSLFANDEFSLDNEVFHELLDNVDDKYLSELFTKGKYTAAVIREGANGNPEVHKYIIRNHKHLAKARELGAYIFPEQVYRNMVFTINKNEATSKLMMLYRRTVVGAFKSIWLTSPGFLLRNFVDSEMYKNMNETGGLVSMAEMFQYEYQAAKLLEQANQIHAEVFARTSNKTFNKAVLTDVLMSLTPEERQLYYITDAFLNSGASGSLTDSMNDFLLQFNKAGAAAREFAWERKFNDMLFNGKYSPTRYIMDVNGKIEQSARFGLLLALIDKGGLTVDEAIARVIKTHFDYTTKTKFEDVLEQLFWFVTFPINNVLYFVNEGLERNPIMLKTFMDINELSWNNGEYTYDELAEKPYLQYHALQGNIRWRNKEGTKDYVLKLSPSLFDFFNIMINPFNEALDRLNPFISVPLGLDEPAQLFPGTGQIRRVQQILEGKSLAPSVYTTMNARQFRNNRRYYNTSYSSWNFKPRRRYSKVKSPKAVAYTVYYRPYNYSRFYTKSRWNYRRISYYNEMPHFNPNGIYIGPMNKYKRTLKKLPVITPEMLPFIPK